jgi:hypothetical protein
MKLLKLDSIYRSWLNSRSALALDSELNEKFIGLTHIESISYAEMTSEPLRAFDLWDVDELARFLELHERHELLLAFRTAAGQFIAR